MSPFISLQIKGGKIQYVSDAGISGKVERSIPEVYVSDGHWHSVFIEKNGTSTVLTVDKTHSRDVVHVTQDFGGPNVLTVSLGGIPTNKASSDPGMKKACGCSFSQEARCAFLNLKDFMSITH